MADFFAPAPEPETELGRLRILSTTAGLRVSPLQLGTMSLGSAWSGALGANSKEEVFKLYDAFFQAGVSLCTRYLRIKMESVQAIGGSLYPHLSMKDQDEESEKWLGEWMAERNNRDQLVIATKFTFDYRAHAFGGPGKTPNHQGNHRRSLYMSIRDSLAKMQTDYVDILYVHAWDYTASVKEVMDSLQFLVAERKVLYLGISDTPAWLVSAANVYANENGKTPFSIYQGHWNVLSRDFERDIIPMARHFGMALAPFGVLGSGRLQSAKQLEERKDKIRGAKELTEEEVHMSEALAKVAAEHGIESVTAIALAYVMHKAQRVFPIVGCRKAQQLQDNIQALSIKLTEEQILSLERVKPFELGFPTAMLGDDPHVTGHSWIVDTAAKVVFPGAKK